MLESETKTENPMDIQRKHRTENFKITIINNLKEMRDCTMKPEQFSFKEN